MMTWSKCIVIAGCVLGLSGVTFADFYDLFGDGQYCQEPNDPNVFDPNAWDMDNPHWTTAILQATTVSFSAQNGALELRSDCNYIWLSSLGAYVDNGNHDANSSQTWFDSSQSFYLLTRVTWLPEPNNPNDPNINGAAILGICLDPNIWGAYGIAYSPRTGDLLLGSLNMTAYTMAQLDDTYRGGLNPRNGAWMLVAHEVECSDPNDANTVQKSLRGAVWGGGKFDWNGQYDVECTYASGPNTVLSPELVHPDGLCGFATFAFPGLTSSTRRCDISFDDVECRRGTFTNQSAILELGVVNAALGTIDVEPNSPDPNDTDPNMPLTMRYTLGTEVVLTATPNPGKLFDYWQILDPNHPYDLNYGTFDTNSVLHLTMNEDVQVVAQFKCGSGLGLLSLLTLFPVLVLWSGARQRA